jgi:hypothetical protein
MSYIDKFGAEDIDYLFHHDEGLKCWQTDYRLLRERDEEYDTLIWLGGMIDFKNLCELDKPKQLPRQRPLFPQ